MGTVTQRDGDMRVFNGAQETIFDAENNRVKHHRVNRIFKEIDHEVQVYDFNRLRLLVSDPEKQMCLQMQIQDLSPVSMVPKEYEGIDISIAFQRIWTEKTSYLGEHDITLTSVSLQPLSVESYHVFFNRFSLLHMEQNYFHEGGAYDSQTLYFFKFVSEEGSPDDGSETSDFY